jgi:hypothetical protein
MRNRARRLLSNMTGRGVRRAQLMLWAALALFAPHSSVGQTTQAWLSAPLKSARYVDPTTRYQHGVLGDAIEHGALELRYDGGNKPHLIRLPETRVFEDTEPRMVDVDGDGQREVVVVESHQNQGARLAIYNGAGLIAATPYIGQRNRWLAPVGVADLDGDGLIELAYVDRPHLAKILRVWRFEEGELTQISALDGVSNHRIGERNIAGGLRDCGSGAEMIVARADWQRLMAVTFDGSALTAREIGPHKGRASFADALACK